MTQKADVVLFVWSLDVTELISLALQDCHLTAAGLEPAEEIDRMEEFIDSCEPSVVVFDLAPPYRTSAKTATLLLSRFPDLPFVFTCADRQLAQKHVPWLSCRPIFQKPYDICAVAELLASLAKPTPQARIRPASDRAPKVGPLAAFSSHAG